VKTSPVVHIVACCSLVSGTLLLGTGNTLAQQKDVRDWEIRISLRDHRSQAIQTRVGYTMVNLTAQQAIKYGEQKNGINLVWDRNEGLANVKFEQDPDTAGTIYEGRATAIHVLNGGYLRYGERTRGINLVWSQSPVYEWQIRHSDPPEPRDTVQSGVRIGLYNTKTQDYVIYCERPYGINLRWAKDCK
jgi:hypothetical protein